ncbi:hypothetical protein [Streptomyces sp. WMMB 322]|uniref:hypothetical protein n=1 Tax=Streptomyces sp. WMMB 322 TaxID=1286821 RepID=UPI0006E130F8|nr:hypothetical protein [Streptomyces sp. WMMB 322]SCK18712.1 hypothetical protein H180DRAFT_01311 [Streptomyces sp. WMMB 322]
MSESTKAALAAGLAAGYVLGRGRKAKLAMAVAAYLASKKMHAKPQELLTAGAERLGDSGQLSQLVEQLRGEVLTVGREALRSVADRRLGSFADALADRTKSLNEVMEAARGEEEGPQGEEEGGKRETGAQEEEGKEDKEVEEGEAEEAAQAGRQRRAPRTGEGRTRPRRPRREPEGQQAPAKKTTKKKAPPRKAAEKSARSSAEPSRRRR